ncbi:MAG: thiolase family protein [Candidatus Abyssobacteria bacterium SURF_17]|uniref:Thiolase family protein n=1 Tax=Candidatus Abyssobacteria bacterium SURF_17 TaxID=2093361 RepID=A0A419ET45_9BACT|nr:MAG: thiolase family protein [Candidatus Abyssubacteria bacterium SURF_17]
MERIAIVGVGQTKHERRKRADSFADMVYEVTTKALADASMTIKDVDNVITVSNDFWDGRTISSMAVTDACGSNGKNVSTVEGDGTFGALYGMMRILSGYYGTTLVVSHLKGSESSMPHITNAMFDPVYERMLGLDSISSSALQARAYMDRYGITEEQCARVSVKNHKNAKNNPNAQVAMDITIDDVMKSRMLADPIKLYDCSPISDGACAIILANEKRAQKITKKPVWVRGVGYCAEAYHLGDRDLADPIALKAAAKKAYSMAGITNPRAEIDVAEIYDAFSYMELLWMEGLGLCEPGRAGRLVEQGVTEMGGELPINPSGGVLSAHTVLVAGLVRIVEAALQLRGDSGKRQVAGAKTALAHGINGPCGQSHCVWILGN